MMPLWLPMWIPPWAVVIWQMIGIVLIVWIILGVAGRLFFLKEYGFGKHVDCALRHAFSSFLYGFLTFFEKYQRKIYPEFFKD